MKNIFIPCALAVVLIVSCKKEKIDNDTQSANDYAVAKMGYNTFLPLTNGITVNEEGLERALYTCATVTRISGDTTNWPANGDTLVFKADFGNGCLDNDGRTKKGILWLYFYNNFHYANATVKVIPDNYYVDNVKYDGTIMLTNNGNYSYTRTITNGVCSNNSWTIKYDGTATFSWTSGYNTPNDLTDDIYSYTENSTGINRQGKSFTVTTSSALIKKYSCKWISSGVLEIKPEGLATRIIDFGNGTCDNTATLTINDRVFNFSMQ
jgi:hypothetical protein